MLVRENEYNARKYDDWSYQRLRGQLIQNKPDPLAELSEYHQYSQRRHIARKASKKVLGL